MNTTPTHSKYKRIFESYASQTAMAIDLSGRFEITLRKARGNMAMEHEFVIEGPMSEKRFIDKFVEIWHSDVE